MHRHFHFSPLTYIRINGLTICGSNWNCVKYIVGPKGRNPLGELVGN